MSVNIVYTLAGGGVSLTYETEAGSVELTLDDSYSGAAGSYQLSGGDLTTQPSDSGVQLAGVLRYEEFGRGGPVKKTLNLTLFVPNSPDPTDSAAELDATGAVVFADPQPRAQIAPAYRAESLTGTLSVPAEAPPGRF
jgi:hypothetical protein